MFICGRKSFSNKESDKNGSYRSFDLTPKRSKKSKSRSKSKNKHTKKKNPYAERGLDEFYNLLADIEEKKQKIYSQIGEEKISFVRFVYSNSFKHVRPIVVRVKNSNSNALTSSPVETLKEEVDDRNEENGTSEEKRKDVMKGFNRSYYCFGVMIVFVLLLLAIYGRSFAILCATIMWYLASGHLEGAQYHQGLREGR